METKARNDRGETSHMVASNGYEQILSPEPLIPLLSLTTCLPVKTKLDTWTGTPTFVFQPVKLFRPKPEVNIMHPSLCYAISGLIYDE